jgi:pyruvate, water dikinase
VRTTLIECIVRSLASVGIPSVRRQGTTHALLRPLPEIDRTALNAVGGKGANLGEMTQAELPVPPGFVVTTPAYEAFLDANELRARIAIELRDLDVDDSAKLQAASARLQAIVTSAVIPAGVRHSILKLRLSHSVLPDEAGPSTRECRSRSSCRR